MIDFAQLSAESFSISKALDSLAPLMLFIGGMTLYALFVFKFYRFLAKRDIFEVNLQQYAHTFGDEVKKFFSLVLYGVEYLLIFPIFVFFWFAVLSLIIGFMSRSGDMGNIMLISMALVASVRITSYYHEDLSKDLAKMLPFALLGVFLVDISFFSLQTALETLKSFPGFWESALYYFILVILLEFVLRMVKWTGGLISPEEKNKKSDKDK